MKYKVIKSSGKVIDFTIAFDPSLSPEQVRATLDALADYYRARGGVGLKVEFAMQQLSVREPVHV